MTVSVAFKGLCWPCANLATIAKDKGHAGFMGCEACEALAGSLPTFPTDRARFLVALWKVARALDIVLDPRLPDHALIEMVASRLHPALAAAYRMGAHDEVGRSYTGPTPFDVEG
jgi:hypothetical protein